MQRKAVAEARFMVIILLLFCKIYPLALECLLLTIVGFLYFCWGLYSAEIIYIVNQLF